MLETPDTFDPPFDPTLDLVVVLETNETIQAEMAKGLLEDAGVPYYVLGQITRLVSDVDPFLKKWVKLQVPRDREEEALEALDPVLHPESWPPPPEAPLPEE